MPRSFRTEASAWKISAPQRTASANEAAPTGMTMNSWRSTLLSACEPPLMMFIIGTGSVTAPSPPRWRYSGTPADAAAACALASDDAEQRVRAEPALVVGAVELEHDRVDRPLIPGVLADQRVAELPVDVGHRLS